MSPLAEAAARNLAAVRERKPLVHNITNFVAMSYTANALLAMGAAPVMAHAPDEVEEMATLASALVLNIGTLNAEWLESMVLAARQANRLDIPVVLDPVGAGATGLRTRAAERILAEARVRVVRGNASEILSLRDTSSRTRGVDAVHEVEAAADAARVLARELGSILAITGPVDLVSDGRRTARVSNGHPLMAYVTGSGCTATALIGAFLAVDPDPLGATATALGYFGLAGELAAKTASAPGSFMIGLLDALYRLGPDELREGCRIALA